MIGDIFAERLLGIPYAVLAAVALAIAVVFVFVATAGTATGWRWFVLRWFHSVCWVLLALAAVVKTKAWPLPESTATPLAVAGGITYAVYLVTLLSGRAS